MVEQSPRRSGMKNKLLDLNNHLFAQLERLGNEDLSAEGLQTEIDRTKAITGVATQVINNASLVHDAHKTQLEYGLSKEIPVLLEQQ
jgi:hypothetical protein